MEYITKDLYYLRDFNSLSLKVLLKLYLDNNNNNNNNNSNNNNNNNN